MREANLEIRVLKVTGEVFTRAADGSLKAVRPGDVLHEGDFLVTRSGGSTELEIPGGPHLEIPPNHSIRINSEGLAPFLAEPAAGTVPATTHGHEAPGISHAPGAKGHPGIAGMPKNPPEGDPEGASRDWDGHGFVRLPRIDMTRDLHLSNPDNLGRDVNETYDFDGRATLNPRIHYDYDSPALQAESMRPDIDRPYWGEENRPLSGWANRPPVANPDTAVTDEDTPVTLDVLANDTDADGHPLSVIEASAGYGTVTINPDGTVTYTPGEDFNGSDTITYTISDGHGGTSTSTVAVTVNPVVDAFDNTASTNEDTAVTTDVLANDTFGPNAEVTGVSQGSHGTVAINPDGTVTYTPGEDFDDLAAGESRTDTYTYTVTTAAGNTETASVTVTVNGTNDAPESTSLGNQSDADADTVTGLDVSGAFSDPDTSDTLAFSASGLPAGLSIDPDTGIISGTIDNSASQGGPGSDGSYSVTVTATDPHGASTSQTFTWDVSNPAPTATDDTHSTTENAPLNVDAANGVIQNDSDPDADTLTVGAVNGSAASVGNPVSGTDGGSFTLNADGSYAFTPGTDFDDLAVGESRTTSLTYTVTDSEGGTDTATLTVTVNGTNDAPESTSLGNQSDADADTVTGLDVSGAFSDPDTSDTLAFSASGLPAGLSIDPDTGIISGTIDNSASQGGPGSDGSYSVTVTATDPHGASTSQTFTWDVSNPAPTATDDTHSTTENAPLNVDAANGVIQNDSDPDADTLTVGAVNGSAASVGNPVSGTDGGSFTLNADGSYAFTPGTDFDDLAVGESRTTSLTYTVTDSEGGTDTATLTVTVNGTNDAPESTSLGNQSDADADTVTGLDVSGAFSDPDTSDTLAFSASGLPAGLSIDPDTGIISGTIDNSASQGGPGSDGSYSVTVTATDPHGASTSQTFTWDVSNPAPTATDDTHSTTENAPLNVDAANGVIQNDSDPDADTLTVGAVNGSAASVGNPVSGTDGGSFTLNADGSYAFTPGTDFDDLAVGESRTTSLTYTVTDSEGGTDTATLTVTVNGTNDAPESTSLGNQSDADADTVTGLDVSGAFSDPDTSDTLAFSASGLPAGLSIDPDTGIISGTIDNSASQGGPGSDGSYSVTVTATDPHGASTSQTFTWDVSNPAPTATDDTHSTTENAPLNVDAANGVIQNDSDPDADTLTVGAVNGSAASVGNPVSGTDGGSFTLNADGSYAFTPGTDFDDLAVGESRTTSLTYTVTDSEGGTDTATLTVTVNGTNDAPESTSLGNQSDADADTVTGLDVSGAFSDPDTSDTLAFSASGLPAGLSIDPDTGIISGTIDNSASQGGPGSDGSYSVTVTATDPHGASTSQTFTWDVSNPAPTATDDTHSTTENAPLNVDAANGVIQNDSDPDADTLTVGAVNGSAASVGNPVSGTDGGSFTLNADGSYAFTPGTDFDDLAVGESRTTSLTYTVTDSEGGTDTATLTVTVNGTNDAPESTSLGNQSDADADTVTGLDVSGAFSDPDTSDTLAFSASGLPAGLSIDPDTGIISGTIDNSASQGGPGSDGSYSVTVTATDPHGASTSQTFTWDVSNPAPTATDDTHSTTENAPLNVDAANGVIQNDSDPDADTLTVGAVNGSAASVGNPVSGTDGGSFTLNADGSYAFTPGTDFDDLAVGESRTTSLTYTVTDSEGGTDTATLIVTVNGTNDAPVAHADTGSVTEDAADQSGYNDSNPATTLIAGNVLSNDTDVDHLDTRSVTGVAPGTPASATGDVAADVAGTYGTVKVNSDGTYTYTLDNTNGTVQALAQGETLTDTFTTTITDSQGGTSSATLTITVHGTNDAPDITVGPGDSAAESLAETNSGLSTSGTLSIFDVDTANTVTATKVNSVSVGGTYTGTVPTNAALIAMFSASGGDPSTTLQSNPNGINWTFNSGSEAFNSIPAGETLVLTYTVRATDSSGATDDQAVTITINGTNDAPVAHADTGSVTEDAADQSGYNDSNPATTLIAGNVLSNDTDVDHLDTRSVTGVAPGTPASATGDVAADVAGTYGTVKVNSDGTYTYTLDNTNGTVQALAQGETLTDTFTTTITDSQGGTSSATLTITVHGTNDAPDITVGPGDSAAESLAETNSGLSTSGTLSIFDVDTANTVTATKVNSVSVGGTYTGTVPTNAALIAMFSASGGDPSTTLQSNPNGINWTFNSGSEAFNSIPAGETLVLTYTVRATDSSGATDDQAVTITINGTNDAPVAHADTGSVTEDAADQSGYNDSNPATTLIAGNVLSNDTDVDHLDTRSVTGVAPGTPASATGDVAADVAGTYGTVKVNSDGTYTYTLDNTNGTVQALAQGETLTDTFTTTITDSQGGTSSATLTITVHGTNDAPDITVGPGDSAAESLAETNSGLSTSGTLSIFDVDTANTVTATKVNSVSVGGTYTGTVPTNAALIAMFSASGGDPSTTLQSNPNGINWTFNSGSEAFNSIPAGETLVLTYTVRATDSSGATDDQAVTITINGTNDAPVAHADTGSVTEDAADQSGYNDSNPATTLIAGNVLSNDTDVDHLDTRSVTGVAPGTPASATGDVAADVAGTYGTVKVNSDGTYTYTLDNTNGTVQALAQGETLTDTFTTTITDSQGGTSSATLTITVHGTNDAPVISLTGTDSDAATLSETNAGLSTSGTLTLTDIDTTNTVSTSVVSVSTGGLTTGLVPNNAQLLAMLTANGNLTNSQTTGPVNWTFNSGSEAFNYLPVGQSLVLTYTVRATDSFGATDDQAVTITINGTNDAPVAVANTGSVTEDAADQSGYNDSNPATTRIGGNVLTNDTDIDFGATKAISAVNGVGGNVGNPVAGTYGTLTVNSNGTYTYTLDNTNPSVQALAAGQTRTETFTTTTIDEHGATSTANLAITIRGANDAPDITVGPGDSAAESLAETNSGLSTSGTLSIFDVDTANTVTATKVNSVSVGGTYTGTVPTNAALIAMFSASGGDPSTTLQSNPNGINWTFNSGSEAFNSIPAGETLVLTYTVRATDSSGATDDQAVTITINGTNDSGAVLADSASLNEDHAFNGNVLSNDVPDPDYNEPLSVTQFTVDADGNGTQDNFSAGDTATLTTASGGTIGTFLLNANGSYTFTPHSNYSGPVPVITYTAGNATFSDTSTLTLAVNPVSDAPGVTAEDSSLETPEDTAISLGLNVPTISDAIDQNGAGTAGDNPELIGPITLSGIPTGARLLDGTDGDSVLWTSTGGSVTVVLSDQANYHTNGASGTLTLTTAQYEALKVLPPADSGTNFTVTVSATEYEVDTSGTPLAGVPGATGTTSVAVNVLAVTDPVDIKIAGSDVSHSVTINEDSSLDLTALLTKSFADTDGSEHRSIILGNLPQGTLVNGVTVGVSGTVTLTLAGGNTLPAISITPPANYSGDMNGITVTLSAQDTDSDSTTTPAILTDTVTLDLHVNPVAGDVTASGVSTTEDTGVKFLGNLAVTDTDGSETLTGVTVRDVPNGWVIRDADGTVVHTGDGTSDFTIDPADVADGDYVNYTLTPPPHSSADSPLTVSVQTTDTQTVDGSPVTSTVTTDLSVPVNVTPVAEVIGGDTDGDGTFDLAMNGNFVYSSSAQEDTWFSLDTDGFDFKSPWANQDADGSEQTFALLTPVLNGGASSANGSQFSYFDGAVTHTLTYNGTAVQVPVAYLDTVQFKAAENISGSFEIQVQAKTVDTDPDTSASVTAVSGSATLSNLLVLPVADQVTLSLSSPAAGLEDTSIPLAIRPTSSDPSETFSVTISGIPNGSTLTYNGVVQAISGGSVTIDNFDRSAPLSILPPANSNVDFTLQVSAVSVDSLGAYTSTSVAAVLPISVDLRGVADPAALTTANLNTTEAAVDGNGHGIALSTIITSAAPTDTDGSERLTLTITGLDPQFTIRGATFIGGTGTGRTWLVDPANLSSATLVTPANHSGTIDLSVRAVTTENDGNSLTGAWIPVSVTVSPSPEATMTTSTTIDEDTLSHLSFSIRHQNGDTDETLSSVWIKAADVDGKDFTLYLGNSTSSTLADAAGTPGSGVVLEDGYYKLSGAAIGSVYTQGDPNTNGTYTFDVRYGVTDPSSDGTLPSVTTQTDAPYTLTVRAVTDETEVVLTGITPSDGNATVDGSTVTATGNTSISIDVSVNPLPDPNAGNQPDVDGSEHLVRFIIDGVPDGVTVAGGVYIGDTPGNPNTGRWLLDINPDAAINGTVSQTLVFNLDGTASELANLDQTLTITAISEDTGSFETQSGQQWTLVTPSNFDDSGAATDLPAEITASSNTPVVTANEDAPINLNDLVDLTITGSSPFSVTLTGLPAGTQVSGMTQTSVNGEVIWTASATGGDAQLQSLLSGITVTPPANWNENNHPEGLNFDTVLTTYAPGGLQNVEHVLVAQPITPVSDPTSLAAIAPGVNEGTTVPITITLSNPADGTAANIVDGKLYLSLNEANMDDPGTLLFGGSPVATQTISGVTGIPDGTYYVIDGVDNGDTLALAYLPAGHASGSVSLSAVLVSQETGAANLIASATTETIVVNPVNSGFDIVTHDVSGNEDTRIELDISGTGLVDTDGSESAMGATLAGVPEGYLVYAGTDAASASLASNIGDDGSGTNTWALSLDNGALPAYIAILPPENFSGTITGLTLTVLSGEENLDPIESSATFDLAINPVADGINLSPTLTFGTEGDPISLNLNSTMIDTDGSETVSLTLHGLGEHAAFLDGSTPLSATYDAGTDTYTLSGISAADIDNLSFIQSARTDTVDVTAWTVESANGNESGTASASFTLNIAQEQPTFGDDTLLYDGTRSYDGLAGNDTLVLRPGENIDFGTDPLIRNIEAFDLNNNGDNHTLDNLSVQDVLDITDSNHTLTILGDAGDNVNLVDDGNWTPAGQVTENVGGIDITFDVFTHGIYTDVTVKIQEEINDALV